MQKITPFLWFDHQAEEAVQFYLSVFRNSKHLRTLRYAREGPGPAGTVMTVAFRIEDQEFTALKRRPGLHVFAGNILCHQLHDSGRSR